MQLLVALSAVQASTYTKPSVTTNAAISIGATSATLSGNLTSKGSYGAGEVDVWFRWRIDANDIWNTTTVSQHVTTGVYRFTLSGLNANTTYEFEAVAYGVDGSNYATSYGTTGKFKTANTTPVITEGASTSVTMDEDGSPTSWNLTLNATDADSDTLTWSILTQVFHGTATASGIGTSKAITYTPAPNWNGSDSFVVQVSDGNGGTASITVNVIVIPVNDAPANTVAPSILGTINVGDTLTADPGAWNDTIDTVVSGTSTLTYTYQWVHADDASGTNAVDIVSATSSLYVLLNSDVHKYLRVRVTCTDNGVGLPATQSVALSTPWTSQVINGLPVITEGTSTSVTMDEDASPTPFSLALHATDADGDTLTWSVPSGASHGTATASGTGSSKNIGYTPTADYNGSDSFVVQVSDGYGGTDDITVSVTVNPINDIPSFTGGADQIVLEDCGAQTVNSWATSISAGPVDEAGQALDFIVTNDNTTLFSTQPAVAANGTLTYTLALNRNGSATVTICIHDDGGMANASVDTSIPQTFTITVNPHNDQPVDTYTLTYTAGANGTISGTSPQTVNQGASSTAVTATPNRGYHFVSWSDGVATAARTDTNVTANINATASFAVDTFAITASAGANGAIDPSGSVSVNYGSTQSFTITSSTGYHVQDVLVDSVSVGTVPSYTFTNVAVSHTIAANFAIDTYILSYTAGTNGTILGTSPQTVNQGASGTTVTATPTVGYHFVSWSDGSLTAARIDTNVTVNVNVSASFAININISINRYTLTANVSGSGSVAKSPDQSSYTHGISVQLTATPATGWHFAGWSGDLSGATNPVTITMDVSKTVTATYAPLPHPVSGHTMVLTIDIKTMTVDSARVVLDAPATLLEDRTLVPLRALVEHLGGTISWNAKTRQVTLKARGTTIVLTIGKSTAFVNDKPLAIDPKNSKVVPILSSSRTMLPLRFVGENLSLQVGWDAKARTITVSWDD